MENENSDILDCAHAPQDCMSDGLAWNAVDDDLDDGAPFSCQGPQTDLEVHPAGQVQRTGELDVVDFEGEFWPSQDQAHSMPSQGFGYLMDPGLQGVSRLDSDGNSWEC